MSQIVFVYGTLKQGFPNYDAYLSSAQFLGKAVTVERFSLYLLKERFVPCLVEEAEQGFHVSGELFAVSDEELLQLDILEDVDQAGWYHRKEIEVLLGDERRIAHSYLFQTLPKEDIHSGPFPEYTLEQAATYGYPNE